MTRENSEMNKYLLSIVMSVYNNVQYIDKAVLSILSKIFLLTLSLSL
jgi:hypothetical protein